MCWVSASALSIVNEKLSLLLIHNQVEVECPQRHVCDTSSWRYLRIKLGPECRNVLTPAEEGDRAWPTLRRLRQLLHAGGKPIGNWAGRAITLVASAGCRPGKILSATARTLAVVIEGLAGARAELTGLCGGDCIAEVDDELPLDWAVPAQAARVASAKTAIAIAKVPRQRAFLRLITR